MIYFLRVIVMMYMQEGPGEAKSFSYSPCLYAAIAITALGVLYLGVAPDPLLELSRISIASLR